MDNSTEIVQRIKSFAVDLEQLERDSLAAGVSPIDALDIEEAATILEHLVTRLTRKPR